MSDSIQPSKKIEKSVWIWLVLITAVAAFFRLYELGVSAFRADTILLWELAKRHVPPGMVLTDWFNVSGAAGQMPMPAFIMQEFLSLLNWPVTPWMVRFPFAFFGILAVPVAFFAGRRIHGRTFGLLLAAFLSVNSFHIATCREAYFYSTLIFGAFLFLLASAGIAQALWERRVIGIPDLVILAAALFFSAYSQITGLILCATGGILFFALLVYRQRKAESFKRNFLSLAVVFGVVLLPVVLASWGLRPILEQIGANKETSAKVVSMSGENLLTGATKALLQFGWGWSPAGWVFFVLALAGAVLAIARKRGGQWYWMVYFVGMQIAVFGALRPAMAATYEARYLAGILPFFLVLLVHGLFSLPGMLAEQLRRPSAAKGAAGVLCGAALVFAAYPAYLQTQLTGKPTPYFDIVRWCDANLPRNTPVLVDRWFEPWNELKSHPSTNVVFTFTIPNEPVDVFVKNRWRETAKDFFARYPDAAYLEIAKEYWDAAGVGPWEWPRQYFAKHAAITNEAGLKLRYFGLANRSDFYVANSNRVVVEIFYNAREDVLSKARAGGQQVIALYGPGWNYTKTQDYRDWRVLEDNAAIDLYNLTLSPLTVQVKIRALAVNGSKQVRASNGAQKTFTANQFVEWTIGEVTLAPGLTQIHILDPLWSMGRTPLVVESVTASVVAAPSAAAPSPAP